MFCFCLFCLFFFAFFASRLVDDKEKSAEGGAKKTFKPLYDVPWMFEAREFLRKKLIGKRVDVTVDYVQPANAGYPEKTCCTVLISGACVDNLFRFFGFWVLRLAKEIYAQWSRILW